jgi:hypothetical protein
MSRILLIVTVFVGIVRLGGIARCDIRATTQPDSGQIQSLIGELLGVDGQRSTAAQDQLAASGDPAEAALLAILDQEGLRAE